MKTITFFGIIFQFSILAQNMPISEQITLGGTLSDESAPNVLFDSFNNSYILGTSFSSISGTKTQNSQGGSDFWISKMSNSGVQVWDKTFGGSISETLYSGLIDEDKMYLIGSSNSNSSGDKTSDLFGSQNRSDLWFLCLNLNGDLQWQMGYGGDEDESNATIVEFSDSSFLIVCQSMSGISGNKTTPNFNFDDLWLIEVAKNDGHLIQQKSFASDGYDEFPSIYNSDSSKFYITCNSTGGISGDKTETSYGGTDVWVIELDENLNIVRDKTFGGNYQDLITNNNMIFTGNDIYLSSTSYSGISGNKTVDNFSVAQLTSDIWLLKLDSELNIIWQQLYGGGGVDYANGLFLNNTGKLVIAGSSKSGAGVGNKTTLNYNTGTLPTQDAWILILDDVGNILNQSSYGGNNDDVSYCFPNGVSNSELLLVANSKSGISGNKTVGNYGNYDIWLAKIDASEFLFVAELNGATNMKVYPNPFAYIVNFEFNEIQDAFQLSFYSLDGKLISEQAFASGANGKSIAIPSQEKMLIYEVKNEQMYRTGKLVRE